VSARGVVCDFGGVLTSPLVPAFLHVQEQRGLPLDALAKAMAEAERVLGEQPLFELERGKITEAEFLRRLEDGLEIALGRRELLHDFSDTWWGALTANEELFDHLRGVKADGIPLVMCTNNVREWEVRWRAMLPIDEVFDAVVDSAWVGVRKPDREIYEVALERIGLPAPDVVFVDDVDLNVAAAAALGMRTVHFSDTAQAILELDAHLGRATGA
jgi:putative hydrolase of the HAD superfamily